MTVLGFFSNLVTNFLCRRGTPVILSPGASVGAMAVRVLAGKGFLSANSLIFHQHFSCAKNSKMFSRIRYSEQLFDESNFSEIVLMDEGV